MWLNKKGQSTAEYAVLIGLIAAVAAGFLSVSLKGAMRSKNEQATNFLMQAGDTELGSYGSGASAIPLYTQEVNQTKVLGGDTNYKNVTVMEKGGSEKKLQKQTTETTAVSVETLDSNQ